MTRAHGMRIAVVYFSRPDARWKSINFFCELQLNFHIENISISLHCKQAHASRKVTFIYGNAEESHQEFFLFLSISWIKTNVFFFSLYALFWEFVCHLSDKTRRRAMYNKWTSWKYIKLFPAMLFFSFLLDDLKNWLVFEANKSKWHVLYGLNPDLSGLFREFNIIIWREHIFLSLDEIFFGNILNLYIARAAIINFHIKHFYTWKSIIVSTTLSLRFQWASTQLWRWCLNVSFIRYSCLNILYFRHFVMLHRDFNSPNHFPYYLPFEKISCIRRFLSGRFFFLLSFY